MEDNYKTEDGHFLSHEDLITLVQWLLINGRSKSEVLNYDGSMDWKRITKVSFEQKENL